MPEWARLIHPQSQALSHAVAMIVLGISTIAGSSAPGTASAAAEIPPDSSEAQSYARGAGINPSEAARRLGVQASAGKCQRRLKTDPVAPFEN